MLDRLDDAFELLADQPRIGSPADDYLPSCRLFVVKKYVIFYQPLPSGISISRVMHSSRDLTQLHL